MYKKFDDELVLLPHTAASSGSVAALVPVMAVVLTAFLIIGLALPVLPLHVNHDLGLGTFIVGLITGSQFAASLLTRIWSGRFADSRGAKRAVLAGLFAATVAGLLYLLSLRFIGAPLLSAGILLSGRALLGAAESFIITGAVSWGLVRAGAQNAGRVIAWIGMAMFAALAIGAPFGTMLYSFGGFAAVAITTVVVPLAAVMLVAPLAAVPPQRGVRPPLMTVAGAVWMPGVASALSSIGFGAIIAFSSLLSANRGWSPVWLVFSAFAFSLVAARFAFGHLPDKHGGAKVALICVLIEAAGLALIWLAPDQSWAVAGAALTGFGYSLVYPGLGIEAVRRAPPQSRGLAMGAYTAFLDVALGFGSPALGLIAGRTSIGAAFAASALLALGTAAIAMRLLSGAKAK